MDYDDKEELKYRFLTVIVVTICITSLITFYATSYILTKNSYFLTGNINKKSEDSIEDIAYVLKQFRTVIDEYYVGEVDENLILDETIKGYINGLNDEYSEYMTAKEWEDFQATALGNYVGIGVYMSQDDDGNAIVVDSIENSPAEESGIKSGDIICEIDGENVIGEKSSVVSDKIKGKEGTTVKLTLERDSQYIPVEVERKEIKIYKVKSKMLENDIGYIQLPTFDEGCSEEFLTAYQELKKQGSKKLIIDLRSNTGGLVEEALSMADMILPKDKIMLITIDAKNNKKITKAEIDPEINDEIVVLVNEYSASASEILVGALKDNARATIVGKKTYGKGVIQSVLPIKVGRDVKIENGVQEETTQPEESVLKITTAEYYTPNEIKINKVGIEPDVEVNLEKHSESEENIDKQLQSAIEILK